MKTRKVAVGVVFRNFPGGIKFLLLKRKHGWKGWEFPKGGVDKGETFREAALREVKEETGLKRLGLVKQVPGKIIYNYPKQYAKKHGYTGTLQKAFLVHALAGKVVVERGMFSGFEWLDAENAFRRLKWGNQRNLLRRIVNSFRSGV
ncbi:MAG: NUDIX domain-containing protein [Candidatus Aenigmarchaeota archaeon]|nr:NUDIX domain-containing protein [Candidatus Aenigmarchaeota archaeon]